MFCPDIYHKLFGKFSLPPSPAPARTMVFTSGQQLCLHNLRLHPYHTQFKIQFKTFATYIMKKKGRNFHIPFLNCVVNV